MFSNCAHSSVRLIWNDTSYLWLVYSLWASNQINFIGDMSILTCWSTSLMLRSVWRGTVACVPSLFDSQLSNRVHLIDGRKTHIEWHQDRDKNRSNDRQSSILSDNETKENRILKKTSQTRFLIDNNVFDFSKTIAMNPSNDFKYWCLFHFAQLK